MLRIPTVSAKPCRVTQGPLIYSLRKRPDLLFHRIPIAAYSHPCLNDASSIQSTTGKSEKSCFISSLCTELLWPGGEAKRISNTPSVCVVTSVTSIFGNSAVAIPHIYNITYILTNIRKPYFLISLLYSSVQQQYTGNMATPTTFLSPTATTTAPTESCTTAVPDKYGYVPFDACNSNYLAPPHFAANLAFTVLFGTTMLAHIVEAFAFRMVRLKETMTSKLP